MNDNPEISRQDFLRDAKKQITHSFFLALAVLGVFAFACYAWFVSNNAVTGQIHSVHIVGSSFELASEGSAGAFDSSITDSGYGVPGNEWANHKGTITSGGKNTILWSLSDESQLGNQAGNTGIHPGSYGKLFFYVIPQQSGTMTISFNLELIPIGADGKPITMDSNPTAVKLTRGHMLFSVNCAEAEGNAPDSEPTLVNYMDPTFSLTFQNAVKDTPIRVELNWIWPLLLEHIQKDNLHGVCGKDEILEWMKAEPSYFFHNDSAEVQAPTDLTNQFREYNNYFNNADQYIGSILNWLVVRLSALQV